MVINQWSVYGHRSRVIGIESSMTDADIARNSAESTSPFLFLSNGHNISRRSTTASTLSVIERE